MTDRYRPPRLLASDDQLGGFECRSVEQTEWLRRHATQAAATGTARVLVVTPPDRADVPDRMSRGAGRYPRPVALLARLGVSVDHEGCGLGAGLLVDVIARIAELGAEIGCRGLVVHAETAEARDFYLHLMPEFASSPMDELHLVLLMKDILKTLVT